MKDIDRMGGCLVGAIILALVIWALVSISGCAIYEGFKEAGEASGLGGKKAHGEHWTKQ